MICTKCGVDKPESDFYRDKDKLKRACKACCRARNKKYRDRDREKGKKRINTQYGNSREIVTLPPWPPSVKVGNQVTVELDVDLRERDAEEATFSGTVIYVDSSKATIKGKHFSQTVERVDLHTKHVRVLG